MSEQDPEPDGLEARNDIRESLEKITAEAYEKHMREVRTIGVVRSFLDLLPFSE